MANIAQKRAQKAQRRKLVVAEKRKVELVEASLPARIARASQAPIQHCLLSASLFEDGMGTVVLARGATSYDVTFASFLLDVFCLGIKNTMFSTLDGESFERAMEGMGGRSGMVPVEPSYARKLLGDLAAWSRAIGFAPYRDFAAMERLFGDVSAEASDATFQFGRDGKPFYVPGPTESSSMVQHRIAQLRNTLGDDGFDLAQMI
jgi:hypothetical protein